jgi:ketosteroid isomerase-like protein
VPADTPQAAEDAFYDALEAGNLDQVMAAWDAGDDIACLLPMQEIARGRKAVQETFRRLFQGMGGLDIQVNHLHWALWADTALHVVEERLTGPDDRPGPAVYAVNVYRRRGDVWHLVLHQNAPAPPPAGVLQPGTPPS